MVGYVAPADAQPDIPQDMAHDAITSENTPAGSFGDIALAGARRGAFSNYLDYMYMLGQKDGNFGNTMTPKQAKEQYGVSIDAPMTEAEVALKKRRTDAETTYDAVAHNAPWYKKFGADAAGFFLDPLNDATLLIPPFAEARVAGLFGKVGLDATTALGKTAVRSAAWGATAGAAQLPISAANYGLNQAAHMDYTIGDSLRETLFAGAVGVVTGPIGGLLHDFFKGTPEWARVTNSRPAENQAAAKAALNQVKNELPFDIMPVYEQAGREARPDVFQTLQDKQAELNESLKGLESQSWTAPREGSMMERVNALKAAVGDISQRLQLSDVSAADRKLLEDQRTAYQEVLDKFEDYNKIRNASAKIIERNLPEGAPELDRKSYYEYLAKRDPLTIEDMAKRQAQLVKEGTVFGTPQQELRDMQAAVDHEFSGGEPELHQQLTEARERADQLENSLRETHVGNAELEKDFKDALSHKEDEAMYHNIYKAAISCMAGVGYV